MVVSFQIQNSRSILDLTVPLTYGERKAPNGYAQMETFPFLEEERVRTIPCLALVGANASGKSNIVKAFEHFTALVKDGYTPGSHACNRLHAGDSVTTCIIDFIHEGHRFRYHMAIDEHEIVDEVLTVDGQPLFSVASNSVSVTGSETQAYSPQRVQAIFDEECLNEERRHHIPLLTVLAAHHAAPSDAVAQAFLFITRNIDVCHGQDMHRLENNQDYFAAITELLHRLDIGIDRMEREQEGWGDEAPVSSWAEEVYCYHTDVEGREVRFTLAEESSGTQQVVHLLGVMLSALRRGALLVIDDLGSSLHPLLLAEIIRLFKDKRYNKTNAQLIFTTHDTEVLDQDLHRVSEIGIVNKTKKRGTTLTRVCEFAGVRNVTNFRKQYLEGNFGGIPFPYI